MAIGLSGRWFKQIMMVVIYLYGKVGTQESIPSVQLAGHYFDR